jgi:hypothetical protein
MHSECSGQTVKAHTVPRAGSLAKIARNGHVYSFVPSMKNLIKNQGVLHPELWGINKASTFTGFCSVHDDKLFSRVEKSPFESAPDQCYLLAYRAYAREVFTKRAAASSALNHANMDRGQPLSRQVAIQRFVALHQIGLDAALRDIEHHKPRFEQPLVTGDYSTVRAYILTFDDPPPVMCSATFAPEEDFEGKKLQDLKDLRSPPALISVTSFFGGTKGHVVFTWLKDDDALCTPFVLSLDAISDTQLGSALVRLMFEFVENVHIAPNWWELLTLQHQQALIARMAYSAGSFTGRTKGCLVADGWSVPGWTGVTRQWVKPSDSLAGA